MNTFALIAFLAALVIACNGDDTQYLAVQYHAADCTGTPVSVALYDYKVDCAKVTATYSAQYSCPSGGNLTTTAYYSSGTCSGTGTPSVTAGGCVVSSMYVAPYYNSSQTTCGTTAVPSAYSSQPQYTTTYYSDSACTTVAYTLTTVSFAPPAPPAPSCVVLTASNQSENAICTNGAPGVQTWNSLNCQGTLNNTQDLSGCKAAYSGSPYYTQAPKCTPPPPPPPTPTPTPTPTPVPATPVTPPPPSTGTPVTPPASTGTPVTPPASSGTPVTPPASTGAQPQTAAPSSAVQFAASIAVLIGAILLF